jgi:uncharacterized membrane protein YgcG
VARCKQMGREQESVGNVPVAPVSNRRAACQAAPQRNERGFALLLVFLMAALVAISLYRELPRAAMQAQRDKEQMLIDRGEQYKRAIQLFVTKARRYPADIKDLENFQNQRFLRHRYPDPMTGKDEWRLVHVMNGVLTDSKVTKPSTPGDKDKTASTPNGFVGEQVGLGGSQNQTQGGGVPNARDRRRPSEGANATMPGSVTGQGIPGGDPSGGQTPVPGAIDPNTGQPVAGQPVAVPPVTGQAGQPSFGQPGMTLPGQQGFPAQQVTPGIAGGMMNAPGSASNSSNSMVGGGGSFVGGGGSFVGGGAVTGSQPANPGQSTNPGQSGYPGQTLPGQPGAAVNSQMGGVSPYPMQPGSNGTPPGFPQPGATTGQGNAAADMIRNILTTPRPGGMPQGNAGGQSFGGGIAGVASTAEGEGVKVYNDHTLYQEWEFIFDPAKVKQIPNPNGGGLGGTPAGQMGTPTPGQAPGATGFGQAPAATGFGQAPGASGFGQPSTPQTGRPPGQ